MDAGHHCGFSRSVVDEDSVVQVSMGPMVDRSKDNLSASDGAVANARLLLLDVLAAYESGRFLRAACAARNPFAFQIPMTPCSVQTSRGVTSKPGVGS